jgi:hypothetical protein
MTAFARVITIGRNDQMPKVVRLPFGVGVDGCAITAPVTIQPDEGVCPDCAGFGYDLYADGAVDCDRCGGGGIITLDDETEPSAGEECLPPPAVEGRPGVSPSSGRLPSSAMTADARVAGDLLHSLNAGPNAHPLLQGVPKIVTASRRPPADPPIGLAGTLLDGFTVIAGLVVFSFIAWFFLVLT